jgi:hypothetical protein
MLKGTLALLVAVLALGAFLLLRSGGTRSEVAPQAREGGIATGGEPFERVRPEDPAPRRVETMALEVSEAESAALLGDREDGPVPRSGTLTVAVRDENGAPVSGAEVWPEVCLPLELMRFEPDGDAARAEEARQRFFEWSRFRRQVAARVATTDASGTAVLEGLSWGPLAAKASKEGKIPAASETVTLSEEQPAVRVEILLQVGGEVAGELRDVHGAPVEGVSLLLRRSESGRSSGRSAISATTDAQGAFAFVDVEPGAWVLRTGVLEDLPAGVLAQEVELEVVAGRTTFVSLPQSGGNLVHVSGRILRNGMPLAAARVRASSEPRRIGGLTPQARADEGGRFDLVLDGGGEWNFQVSPGSDEGTLWQTVIVPQAPRHEVVLDFSTGSLSGRVLGPQGEAVAGAQVTAFAPRLQGATGPRRGIGMATCDSEGRYALVDLPAGVYSVQAHPVAGDASPFWGAGVRSEVELAPGQDLTGIDVHLSSSGSIQGRVLREGSEVAGVWVELRTERSRASARSEVGGVYELGGADEGPCWVRATKDDWTSPWTSAVVRQGRATPLDLALEPGARVVVEVEDDSGSVEQASVSLRGGDEITMLSVLVRKGRGEERAVPAGTYQVVARRDWREKDPARMATTTVTLVGGEERVVRLRLP